jgi:PAS domain S-box-containing protein
MEQKENIFKNAPFGYALHRIILDEAGKPVDYEFIEVNNSFEKLTGLVKTKIIGKKVTEAIPGIDNGDFDWIGFYGKVALEETEGSFEQYSEPLGKHYQVQVYSPQKEYFITFFSDVSAQKIISEIAEKFNEFNTKNIDYKYIADKAREISGAKYAILNKFDEHGRVFSTVGFSGISKHLKKAVTLLGFDVIGKKWAYDPDRQKKIEESQITVFEKLIDLTGNIISNDTINVLCKAFDIGKVAVVKITKDGNMLADFTLIFSKNEHLQNHDTIKSYAGMTGMLINRIESERKIKESQQRLDMLMSNTPAVIYSYQFVGNKMEITYINENIKNIIGFIPEEFIGHEEFHQSCVHPDDKKYMLDELMQLVKGKKDTVFLTYRFKDKKRNYRWLADTHKVLSRNEEKVECVGAWWDTTEEKESRLETEKLKEQFELAIAGTNDGIWDWNLKTNELFLSKRWKMLLGYEDSEIKNVFDSFISLIYEDDIPKVNDFVQRYLKGEIENYEIEFRMKHKDGSLRWILAKGEALRDGKGIPYRMAGSHGDITERKEIEAELKENKERMQLAMDAGEHGFWDWNLNTNNTYFSPVYYTMLGYEDKELPMNLETFTKLIHPEDAKYVMPEIQHSIETGKPYDVEFRLKCKDGAYKWIMGKGKTYFDEESGKPNRAVGVHVDINERKIAEEKLRESEIRFNAAIEGTEAGIWDWDMIANTVTFSKQWKTMLGYDEDEVENSFDGWKNLWHPDDVVSIEKSVNDHLAGKTKQYEIVNRLKHKDGSWHWIMTRGKLLRDDNNKAYRWVGTNIDITSQKEVENELAETNKTLVETTAKANLMAAEAEMANAAKSEFLANMSHEIRTPMNSVIGFSELLQGTDLNKIQKQYVDTVVSNGKGLLCIINDILDFSKIEAGKLDLEIIQTDLIDLIEQTADLIKYPASKKGIELLLDIDPELPRFAMVDPVRLRQILANLLSNALKFTAAGEIELKVSLLKKEDNRGQIKLSVRDTGIGISDAQKEKIFKAFSQADSSTTRKFGGTGLGLIISDQLAQKMGCRLEVSSNTGEGSEFYFTIETVLKDGDKLKEADIGNIQRCLVIDDNENNRMIMEHLLAKWEIECITCDNGFESLKVIEQSKAFDVIICDYHMPYLDGLETVKMMREKLQLPPEKQPVILLHSSSDDAELQKKCKELGIYFRLTKPVKQDDLFNCFANIQKGVFKEDINIKAGTDEKDIITRNNENEYYKILIAEDNDNNMLFITTIIKQILPGVKVIEAGNGKEALEKIINLQPDLVFMDVQMPEMDGNEATSKLRQNETKDNKSHTVVVGLTAGALKQEKDKSIESGMDDFLTKPVETDKLKAVLNKYLKKEKTPENNIQEDDQNGNEENPSISSKDHFDREELFEMISRDRSVLNKLISFFIKDTQNTLNDLEALLKKNCFQEAAKIVHLIKGSSANIRCKTFVDLIKKIEREILEEHSEAAGKTLQEIKNEWEILLPILKQSISG